MIGKYQSFVSSLSQIFLDPFLLIRPNGGIVVLKTYVFREVEQD